MRFAQKAFTSLFALLLFCANASWTHAQDPRTRLASAFIDATTEAFLLIEDAQAKLTDQGLRPPHIQPLLVQTARELKNRGWSKQNRYVRKTTSTLPRQTEFQKRMNERAAEYIGEKVLNDPEAKRKRIIQQLRDSVRELVNQRVDDLSAEFRALPPEQKSEKRLAFQRIAERAHKLHRSVLLEYSNDAGMIREVLTGLPSTLPEGSTTEAVREAVQLVAQTVSKTLATTVKTTAFETIYQLLNNGNKVAVSSDVVSLFFDASNYTDDEVSAKSYSTMSRFAELPYWESEALHTLGLELQKIQPETNTYEVKPTAPQFLMFVTGLGTLESLQKNSPDQALKDTAKLLHQRVCNYIVP
jgi:hypothetical protein